MSVAPGEQVYGYVVIRNLLAPGHVRIAARFDNIEAATSPAYVLLETNQEYTFIFTFTMPSYNVQVRMYSATWTEEFDPEGTPTGEWYWLWQEEVGPFTITAQIEVPAGTVENLNVAYRKT